MRSGDDEQVATAIDSSGIFTRKKIKSNANGIEKETFIVNAERRNKYFFYGCIN